MQRKPKRDQLERSLHTFWLWMWATWAVLSLAAMVAGMLWPGVVNWPVSGYACPLLVAHLLTHCLLTIRRTHQERDEDR